MSKISSKNINKLSVPQSPVVLAILDGWGFREDLSDNAIKSANTPIMDSLWHAYPHTLISEFQLCFDHLYKKLGQ